MTYELPEEHKVLPIDIDVMRDKCDQYIADSINERMAMISEYAYLQGMIDGYGKAIDIVVDKVAVVLDNE